MGVRRSLTPVALIACLVAAGCGDDDDGGDGGNWVREANRICRESTEQLADLPRHLGLDPDAPAFRKALSIAEETNEKLRALEPPDDVARELNRFVELKKEAEALGVDFVATVRARSEAGTPEKQASHVERSVEILKKQRRTGRDAARTARGLGLTACARELR